MTYRVFFSASARKQLQKMDRFRSRLIFEWLEKNIDGCSDPRMHGKALTANHRGKWRYRIGDYRVLCLIRDSEVVVEVFQVGHRRDIYDDRLQ